MGVIVGVLVAVGLGITVVVDVAVIVEEGNTIGEGGGDKNVVSPRGTWMEITITESKAKAYNPLI